MNDPGLPRLESSSVTAGFANNLGALHLDFADGSVLDISADEHYEAWTLNGPDGLLLVSTPRGRSHDLGFTDTLGVTRSSQR
ncbi:DUF6188 family protein [Arthrobacter sp. M2012083]|uniref:DUF6188 family protein n=1 Tax=Arthrobacter sp. M2012083 TaxID=1197706 RepID=UPI000362B877